MISVFVCSTVIVSIILYLCIHWDCKRGNPIGLSQFGAVPNYLYNRALSRAVDSYMMRT
jgi:hypothetical protein